MRDLNAVEMEFVAGGRASATVVKTAHTVALASGKGAALKKISSHAAANLSDDTVAHTDEEIVDDGGGGGGGGDDGGGGGDDTGGDSGGGDTGDTGDTGDSAWVEDQGEPPTGEHLEQAVSDNGSVTATCKGTAGGGSQCVVGTASDFVVTTTDSHGNIISQLSCTKDTDWSFSLALSLLKGIFDGGQIQAGATSGYTCTPVKK